MRTNRRGIGEVLFPKVDEAVAITASAGAPGSIRDVLEDHLGTGELILSAVLDVAERGRAHSEEIGNPEMNERYNTIIGLLEMYRAGNSALIEKLYQANAVRVA
jgi:hypothetical protein